MGNRIARPCDRRVLMDSFFAAFVIASAATQSTAEELGYPDFSYTFGLELNGDAESVVDREESILRIVPAKQGQGGTFFYNKQLPVTNFHTEFSFRFSDVGGIYDHTREVGGDGFVFTIQPVSATFGWPRRRRPPGLFRRLAQRRR